MGGGVKMRTTVVKVGEGRAVEKGKSGEKGLEGPVG